MATFKGRLFSGGNWRTSGIVHLRTEENLNLKDAAVTHRGAASQRVRERERERGLECARLRGFQSG